MGFIFELLNYIKGVVKPDEMCKTCQLVVHLVFQRLESFTQNFFGIHNGDEGIGIYLADILFQNGPLRDG